MAISSAMRRWYRSDRIYLMTDVCITSEAAWARLLEGNARYVAGASTATNSPEARAALVNGQSPVAAVVCCADSRSVPEVVFDQPMGSLFTCALAGNIVTDEVIASLDHAIDRLQIPLIVVLGHTGCAAVTAAVEGTEVPATTAAVVEQICTGGERDPDVAASHHVAAMVVRLQAQTDVQVVGAMHDLRTGSVR